MTLRELLKLNLFNSYLLWCGLFGVLVAFWGDPRMITTMLYFIFVYYCGFISGVNEHAKTRK